MACKRSLVRLAIMSRSCSANTASNLNLYRVRKRIVASDKINLRFPQSRDEMRVASEAIELGNDRGRFLPLTGSEGSFELRATFDRVLTLPGLDFTELAHELPATAVEIGLDGQALGGAISIFSVETP